VTRNALRRRARAVVRSEAMTLPRGTYLVRLDPAAGTRPREQFRNDVALALQRAGRAGGVGVGE
jgi:RNase P protein component